MFESSEPVAASAVVVPLSNEELAAFRSSLRGFDPSLDDDARLDRIRLLEQAKAAIAAAQAVEVAAFVRSRREVAAAEIASTRRPGVGKRRRIAEAERGIVTDVQVARRVSPGQARRYIRFALDVPAQLPAAFAQLAAGAVSERRVLSLHHATTWLTAERRQTVDAELAPRLAELGDKQVITEAQRAGYALDPQGACDRVAAAENDRHVSLRPAPESMTRLSALLPLVQGVAVLAALDRAASTAAAAGDTRGRGQVMADTLVERVTGQSTATGVPVEVQLVMTDHTLLAQGAGADEPVRVVGGHGWLPAPLARDLILGDGSGNTADSGDTDTPAARSIRRLFTDPAGRVITMETNARLFSPAMGHLVRVRDDTCRTPWCDAPIRQTDHIHPDTDGGPTSIGNARGLCTHCNLAAQAPGAVSRHLPQADGTHLVIGLTPMGRAFRSRPPDLPGARTPRPTRPAIEIIWNGPLRHAA